MDEEKVQGEKGVGTLARLRGAEEQIQKLTRTLMEKESELVVSARENEFLKQALRRLLGM